MRSIPTLEGNHPLLMDSDYKARTDPLQKCAEAALDKGYRVLAYKMVVSVLLDKTEKTVIIFMAHHRYVKVNF